MARPAKYTDDLIQAAQQLVKEAKTVHELRTGLSVTIPKSCNVSNFKTAELLCVGVATVVVRYDSAKMRTVKIFYDCIDAIKFNLPLRQDGKSHCASCQ